MRVWFYLHIVDMLDIYDKKKLLTKSARNGKSISASPEAFNGNLSMHSERNNVTMKMILNVIILSDYTLLDSFVIISRSTAMTFHHINVIS